MLQPTGGTGGKTACSSEVPGGPARGEPPQPPQLPQLPQLPLLASFCTLRQQRNSPRQTSSDLALGMTLAAARCCFAMSVTFVCLREWCVSGWWWCSGFDSCGAALARPAKLGGAGPGCRPLCPTRKQCYIHAWPVYYPVCSGAVHTPWRARWCLWVW